MKNFTFITAHDYRTPRKASLHFIADELIKQNKTVNFFSMRYSLLSKRRPDSRHVIADKVNKLEVSNNVNCYFWKTPLHPVNTNRIYLRLAEAIAFRIYVMLTPKLVKKWLKNSDIIFLESGAPPIYLPMVKKLNPASKVIYIGSDELDAINVAQYVKNIVKKQSLDFDYIIVNSPQMVKDFADNAKLFYVPHGIDKNVANYGDPNPYDQSKTNAVSIGSMLFDLSLVIKTAELFPKIQFHIIGSGQDPSVFSRFDNIIFYDEMPYVDTIKYIKHANFGIAPYLHDEVPSSLADTSMKLQQYTYFGIPAVCPNTVVGHKPHRFGYNPKDDHSIKNAINLALEAGKKHDYDVLDWGEVTQRILEPAKYKDTNLSLIVTTKKHKRV